MGVRDAPFRKDRRTSPQDLGADMDKFGTTSAVRPRADMNKREWLMTRWIAAGVYAIIVLIATPWLLIRGSALGWLPITMAAGPFMAGLWLFATHQIAARTQPRDYEKKFYRQASLTWLARSMIVAAVVGVGAYLALFIGGGSWTSYDILRSSGSASYVSYTSYAILGSLPVIAYMMALQRLLAKRRSMTLTYIFAVVSLLAPWFWAGFELYGQYHQL